MHVQCIMVFLSARGLKHIPPKLRCSIQDQSDPEKAGTTWRHSTEGCRVNKMTYHVLDRRVLVLRPARKYARLQVTFEILIFGNVMQ